MPPRLLILGLGNDILTDDAIGLRVVRGLRSALADQPAVELQETTEMGLALLDYLTGFPAAFVVDAIQTGQAEPGFIHELDAPSLRQLTGGTPHFLGVGETLALGGLLGLPMPGVVKIFAIEAQDPFTLGARMTPALEAALPHLVESLARSARLWLIPASHERSGGSVSLRSSRLCFLTPHPFVADEQRPLCGQ